MKIYIQMFISFLMFSIIMFSFGEFPEGKQHQKLKGNDIVYTKQDVDDLINPLINSEIVCYYPMFCIDLNTDVPNYSFSKTDLGYITDISLDGYSMSEWTGFEIKASTNNFYKTSSSAKLNVTNSSGTIIKSIDMNVPGIASDDRVLYWCASEMDGFQNVRLNHLGRELDRYDSMRKYTCEDRNISSEDNRSWKYFENSSVLSNKYPYKVYVILDPSKFRWISDSSWCVNTNKNLNWVFIRTKTSDFERDDNGMIAWHPIYPVKWFKELPAWAYTNGEVRVVSEEFFNKTNK